MPKYSFGNCWTGEMVPGSAVQKSTALTSLPHTTEHELLAYPTRDCQGTIQIRTSRWGTVPMGQLCSLNIQESNPKST